MLPTRWDPFRGLGRELGTLHREMDDLFRRTFGMSRETADVTGFFATPPINTYTKGKTFCIEAEIPGVDKDDLDVSVEQNVLTLRGERKAEKETKEEDYLVRESHYGSFLRRMTLPEGVNTEEIQAKYEDGVLKISMPMDKKLEGGRKVLIEGSEKSEKGKKVH